MLKGGQHVLVAYNMMPKACYAQALVIPLSQRVLGEMTGGEVRLHVACPSGTAHTASAKLTLLDAKLTLLDAKPTALYAKPTALYAKHTTPDGTRPDARVPLRGLGHAPGSAGADAGMGGGGRH